MDQQTHLMINSANYNAEPKSAWSSISESLVGAAGKVWGQRGNIVEGVGQWYEGQVESQASQNLAQQFGSQALSFGLQADMARLAGIIPGVQEKSIEFEALANRSEAIDQWTGRWGSTRAGYAAAGIAVDVGTPVLAAGKLLKSLDQELSVIDLNHKIRVFNEVTIPMARAEIESTQAKYGQKMAKAQQKQATSTADTQEKIGWANALVTGFKVIGELL